MTDEICENCIHRKMALNDWCDQCRGGNHCAFQTRHEAYLQRMLATDSMEIAEITLVMRDNGMIVRLVPETVCLNVSVKPYMDAETKEKARGRWIEWTPTIWASRWTLTAEGPADPTTFGIKCSDEMAKYDEDRLPTRWIGLFVSLIVATFVLLAVF